MEKSMLMVSIVLLFILIVSVGGLASEKSEEGVYDPPIIITIGKQLDENAGLYKKGESLNDNVLTRWGVEKLGIKIKTTLLGGDHNSYNTKLRLALTGADKLPDVFPVYTTQMMSDLIASGQVQEISDEIEKYMSDRLKEVYEKFPQAFYPVTGEDGGIYGLPINPNLVEGQVMLIRKDWLDNLGLEAPTNIEEFETILDAFTNDDPDGNGVDDTYGFTFSGYNTGWVADSVMIFSAYTGRNIPGQWQTNEKGKLVYGSVQDGNKKALAKMQEWYNKGYLNPEFAVQGAWDALAPFTRGKAGIVLGRPWVEGELSGVQDIDPEAEIDVYPFIKGVDGGPTYQNAETNDGQYMFSKDFDNIETFFVYLDKLYDVAFATGDFKYGFFEDYDYDIVDGEVVFDPLKFEPPMKQIQGVGKMAVSKNTPSIDMAGKSYFEVYNGKEPETGIEMRAAAARPVQLKGYAISYKNRDTQVSNLFLAPPTRTMQMRWEQLNTLENEVYTDIIYGRRDIDAFDDFVVEWNELGGKSITEEVNKWYKGIQ